MTAKAKPLVGDYPSKGMERRDCEPWRDEKTLRHLYHGKDYSSRKVGSLLGVSKGTVLRWMENLGVDKRPGPTKAGPWRDKETVRQEYVTAGRSINDLASEWDTSTATVWRWINRHGFDTREAVAPSGRDHWNWKGDDAGPDPRECPECGKTHTPDDYRVDYCSRDCAAESLKNRVTIECEVCDKSCEVVPSREDTARVCSYDCLGKLNRGEGSGRWRGGHDDYYGENWQRQRRKARERDDYECQSCGLPESEHDTELHVHHRERIARYQQEYDAPEWWEKANRLENLVTLCRDCHHEWESWPVQPVAEVDL